MGVRWAICQSNLRVNYFCLMYLKVVREVSTFHSDICMEIGYGGGGDKRNVEIL